MKENEKSWKIEEEDRLTERQKKEKKNKIEQEAARRKKGEENQKIQKKITETWKRIPEHERKHLMQEEERKRRFELREAKINVWKKWRRESAEKKKETEDSQRNNQESWLQKLENTLQRMRKEIENRKVEREAYEARRKKLIKEKKDKQENKLRMEYERKERKEKKKMLQERWAMARWATQYLDENSEKWEREKEERKKTEKERADEWHRMNRFEKIRILKEKQEENKKVTVQIRRSKLQQPQDVSQAEPEHRPGECPVDPPCPVSATQHSKEDSLDRAEHQHRHGDDLGRAEHQHQPVDDLPQQSNSLSSTSLPQKVIQPTAIIVAVGRCVGVHNTYQNLPILTSNPPGTVGHLQRGQAEQLPSLGDGC